MSTRSARAQRRAAKQRNQRIIVIVIIVLLLGAGAFFAYRAFFPSTSAQPPQIANGDMVTTASGLQYQDIVVGEGTEAKSGDRVSVHYTGWLEDGTKFDSSLDRGTPFEFTLGVGEVIKGWDEGLAGMKIGGKRQLVIPSKLAYGSAGAGNLIPPDATLVFEVELLGIK